MSKLIKLKKEYETMNDIMIKNNTNLESVDDFYNKIKTDMALSMKSFLSVAKNLHLARNVLDEKDYVKLCKKLNLARATTYKLMKIIQSEYTEYLIERNRLPQSWTIAEKITKLTKDQFNKIKNEIEVDLSSSLLNKLLGKVSKVRQSKNITINCPNAKVLNYLSKKIEVLIKETNDHFKIANSVVLKLPTKKVSI